MSNIPITQVLELIKKGISNEEITNKMEAKGFTLQQIGDAINQAKIKQGVEGKMPMQESVLNQDIPMPQQGAPPAELDYTQQAPPMPEPMPQQQAYYPPQQATPSYGDMQAIVEQIVEEKWRDLMKGIGDIAVFRARVSDDMEAVKQELLRTNKRLEDLQVAIMGKVKDYHQGMTQIGTDMKALEKVFGKILEPLTMNIKELDRLTKQLKKK